jgi:hypothetical protein
MKRRPDEENEAFLNDEQNNDAAISSPSPAKCQFDDLLKTLSQSVSASSSLGHLEAIEKLKNAWLSAVCVGFRMVP